MLIGYLSIIWSLRVVSAYYVTLLRRFMKTLYWLKAFRLACLTFTVSNVSRFPLLGNVDAKSVVDEIGFVKLD